MSVCLEPTQEPQVGPDSLPSKAMHSIGGINGAGAKLHMPMPSTIPITIIQVPTFKGYNARKWAIHSAWITVIPTVVWPKVITARAVISPTVTTGLT